MAVITIYEDDLTDLYRTYDPLFNNGHRLILYYSGDDDITSEETVGELVGIGFKKEDIHRRVLEPEESDFYFIDGLRGHCFGLFSLLPKEKCYLVSGDPFIREEAEKRHLNVLEGDISDLIERGQK